jgi:hypothetical protein
MDNQLLRNNLKLARLRWKIDLNQITLQLLKALNTSPARDVIGTATSMAGRRRTRVRRRRL